MSFLYDHEAVKKYIVDLLIYYGFDARAEVWTSVGRIDVAGKCVNNDLCKGYSIAVEISKTSDLAKDLDKLRKVNYDLKFVILLKPYEELPPVGDIRVIRPEKFEYYLRYLLDTPMTYHPYPGEIPCKLLPPIGRLEEFKRYLAEELGFPEFIDYSLRFILKTYALGETLFKTVYIPLYSSEQFVDVYEDLRMVEILRQMRIINIEGRGAYASGKIFLASLSQYGEELARSIAMKEILNNEPKIKEEISKYNIIIPFITSITCWKRVGRKQLCCLELPENLEVAGSIVGISYNIEWLYDNISNLRIPPEAYLFAINSSNLPIVLKKCIEFAKRFEKLQLAFIGGMYGSKGKYYGDKICIVPELADYILKMTRDEALHRLDKSGLLNEFNTIIATYIVGDRAYREAGLESLDEVLACFRVSKEDLKKIVERMHEKGITSKFLDKPPYIIILNMEEFRREIMKALREIEAKIISL
ncbi:hypothetical protein [Staphylothermus hellenicus]|uniref:Uncharacterized protein n=1 Tax=Staphylothermus hellenicus (strain DSM 12710 / JCM 10830 / BK20S6-10-b1 / P8) TaxID=591019 RepID=D7D8B8_STAHD|nr:hypothetical protein [Staphylothermus hellenicus]ADI32014.1 hypothetical protein Shell_0906 [Staphylothermus hellenicus DSM 12710]